MAITLMGCHVPGFWRLLVSAALAIIVGGLLIWWPAGGVLSLTLLLTLFFLVDGVASIMFAFGASVSSSQHLALAARKRHYRSDWL